MAAIFKSSLQNLSPLPPRGRIHKRDQAQLKLILAQVKLKTGSGSN